MKNLKCHTMNSSVCLKMYFNILTYTLMVTLLICILITFNVFLMIMIRFPSYNLLTSLCKSYLLLLKVGKGYSLINYGEIFVKCIIAFILSAFVINIVYKKFFPMTTIGVIISVLSHIFSYYLYFLILGIILNYLYFPSPSIIFCLIFFQVLGSIYVLFLQKNLIIKIRKGLKNNN